MVLQILHRGRLARRTRQACLYKLSKNIVLDTVEHDIVKYPVRNQVGSVNSNVGYTIQKLFGVHQFLFAPYLILAEQIKPGMYTLLLSVNLFLPLFYQSIHLFN